MGPTKAVRSSRCSFFFSSRRRHTRSLCDWSSDVCSSDLGQQLWIYYPNFKSAEHYSLAKRSSLDAAISAITTALNLENVEHTFHIIAAKGEKGYDLELTPRNPSMKRIFQKLLLH